MDPTQTPLEHHKSQEGVAWAGFQEPLVEYFYEKYRTGSLCVCACVCARVCACVCVVSIWGHYEYTVNVLDQQILLKIL